MKWSRNARVQVAPLRDKDMLRTHSLLIGRDGAGLIEVELRLQKALASLATLGDAAFHAAVTQQAAIAEERARGSLSFDRDRDCLSLNAHPVICCRPNLTGSAPPHRACRRR